MWRLLNKLFGWDYVIVECTHNLSSASDIKRVKKAPNGLLTFKTGYRRRAVAGGRFDLRGELVGAWLITPLTKGVTANERISDLLQGKEQSAPKRRCW